MGGIHIWEDCPWTNSSMKQIMGLCLCTSLSIYYSSLTYLAIHLSTHWSMNLLLCMCTSWRIQEYEWLANYFWIPICKYIYRYRMIYIYIHTMCVQLICIVWNITYHSVAKITFNPWSLRLLCPGCFLGYTPRTTEVRSERSRSQNQLPIISRVNQAQRKRICLYYVTTAYYIVVTYNNLSSLLHIPKYQTYLSQFHPNFWDCTVLQLQTHHEK